MIMEKLIEKKEKVVFPEFTSIYPYKKYSPYSDRVFYSVAEYWYDGRMFLIGSFTKQKNDMSMIDKETGVFAVNRLDFVDGKPSIKKVIDLFKLKLKNSGKTIHEVVRDYKLVYFDMELWKINMFF